MSISLPNMILDLFYNGTRDNARKEKKNCSLAGGAALCRRRRASGCKTLLERYSKLSARSRLSALKWSFVPPPSFLSGIKKPEALNRNASGNAHNQSCRFNSFLGRKRALKTFPRRFSSIQTGTAFYCLCNSTRYHPLSLHGTGAP